MRKIKYKWTDDQLIEAVKNSTSIRQILIALCMYPTGQNYRVIPKRIKELNLDTSHFLGRGHLKGRTHTYNKNRSIEEILTIGTTMYTRIKKRLIREGILENKCKWCGILSWANEEKEIVSLELHLDHINGINTDNRIDNLRLLCPNCHSLTSTFAGKNVNKGIRVSKKKYPKIKSDVCICGDKMSAGAINCKNCAVYSHSTIIDWPDDEELVERIKKSNITQVAKELGCSRQGVSRHLNRIEITKAYCECGKEKFPNASLCRTCQGFKNSPTKITWPSDEDLINMIKNSSYLAVGKSLGVSDNAIRKRLRNRGYNTSLLNLAKEIG